MNMKRQRDEILGVIHPSHCMLGIGVPNTRLHYMLFSDEEGRMLFEKDHAFT